MTGFFVWALSVEGVVSSWTALVLFTVAATTDGIDGWLARKYALTTPFGIFMDPLADKVLVISALAMFLWLNLMPVWMFIVIVTRELFIMSVRWFALTEGEDLPAMPAGKQKMVSQIVAIVGTLVVLCAQYTIQRATGLPYMRALDAYPGWGPRVAWLMTQLPFALLLIATILSVTSGGLFLWHYRRVFRQP